MKKDFLSITDVSSTELWQILKLAKELKLELQKKGKHKPLLGNKSMVLLFEKPSLRTKLSFDIGFSQLGGHPIYFGAEEVGLGKREAIDDVAKVISSMSNIIVARVFNHQNLIDLANNSTIPVINALSDLEHPCQILADLLTVWEIKNKLKGLTLAYIGDCENNVAHSLALGCGLLGINFKCASPQNFTLKKEIADRAKILAKENGSAIIEANSPSEAVYEADVVYTDTWISMGDETEKKSRLQIFADYQVNQKLMSLAKPDAIFMHDMPAYRGQEVTPEIIDGQQSVIFQQAENRLHAQKALLLMLAKA
ncbi:MAG TPA: ornithine carbamoyltransferase [Patescibacteria group bacterium]